MNLKGSLVKLLKNGIDPNTKGIDIGHFILIQHLFIGL